MNNDLETLASVCFPFGCFDYTGFYLFNRGVILTRRSGRVK